MITDIKIITNHVFGGWNPTELPKMLGGSEECVVLLSEALKRSGYSVFVYHTTKGPEYTLMNGVEYYNRDRTEIYNTDTVITFKDPTPFIEGAKCKTRIHWSCEVEKYWDTSKVDHYVSISEFHKSRNSFSGSDLVIPMGIDTDHLNRNKTKESSNTVLYSSSPDRGLLTLLNDWNKIRKNYHNLELVITYGFDIFDKIVEGTGENYQKMLMNLMEQDGVTFLGEISQARMAQKYWTAKYWILPLGNPDSELFCLNALKSRYCGATPIVNHIGALRNTVGNHIKYSDFIAGNPEVTENKNYVPVLNWDDIVNEFWKPLLD